MTNTFLHTAKAHCSLKTGVKDAGRQSRSMPMTGHILLMKRLKYWLLLGLFIVVGGCQSFGEGTTWPQDRESRTKAMRVVSLPDPLIVSFDAAVLHSLMHDQAASALRQAHDHAVAQRLSQAISGYEEAILALKNYRAGLRQNWALQRVTADRAVDPTIINNWLFPGMEIGWRGHKLLDEGAPYAVPYGTAPDDGTPPKEDMFAASSSSRLDAFAGMAFLLHRHCPALPVALFRLKQAGHTNNREYLGSNIDSVKNHILNSSGMSSYLAPQQLPGFLQTVAYRHYQAPGYCLPPEETMPNICTDGSLTDSQRHACQAAAIFLALLRQTGTNLNLLHQALEEARKDWARQYLGSSNEAKDVQVVSNARNIHEFATRLEFGLKIMHSGLKQANKILFADNNEELNNEELNGDADIRSINENLRNIYGFLGRELPEYFKDDEQSETDWLHHQTLICLLKRSTIESQRKCMDDPKGYEERQDTPIHKVQAANWMLAEAHSRMAPLMVETEPFNAQYEFEFEFEDKINRNELYYPSLAAVTGRPVFRTLALAADYCLGIPDKDHGPFSQRSCHEMVLRSAAKTYMAFSRVALDNKSLKENEIGEFNADEGNSNLVALRELFLGIAITDSWHKKAGGFLNNAPLMRVLSLKSARAALELGAPLTDIVHMDPVKAAGRQQDGYANRNRLRRRLDDYAQTLSVLGEALLAQEETGELEESAGTNPMLPPPLFDVVGRLAQLSEQERLLAALTGQDSAQAPTASATLGHAMALLARRCLQVEADRRQRGACGAGGDGADDGSKKNTPPLACLSDCTIPALLKTISTRDKTGGASHQTSLYQTSLYQTFCKNNAWSIACDQGNRALPWPDPSPKYPDAVDIFHTVGAAYSQFAAPKSRRHAYHSFSRSWRWLTFLAEDGNTKSYDYLVEQLLQNFESYLNDDEKESSTFAAEGVLISNNDAASIINNLFNLCKNLQGGRADQGDVCTVTSPDRKSRHGVPTGSKDWRLIDIAFRLSQLSTYSVTGEATAAFSAPPEFSRFEALLEQLRRERKRQLDLTVGGSQTANAAWATLKAAFEEERDEVREKFPSFYAAYFPHAVPLDKMRRHLGEQERYVHVHVSDHAGFWIKIEPHGATFGRIESRMSEGDNSSGRRDSLLLLMRRLSEGLQFAIRLKKQPFSSKAGLKQLNLDGCKLKKLAKEYSLPECEPWPNDDAKKPGKEYHTIISLPPFLMDLPLAILPLSGNEHSTARHFDFMLKERNGRDHFGLCYRYSLVPTPSVFASLRESSESVHWNRSDGAYLGLAKSVATQHGTDKVDTVLEKIIENRDLLQSRVAGKECNKKDCTGPLLQPGSPARRAKGDSDGRNSTPNGGTKEEKPKLRHPQAARPAAEMAPVDPCPPQHPPETSRVDNQTDTRHSSGASRVDTTGPLQHSPETSRVDQGGLSHQDNETSSSQERLRHPISRVFRGLDFRRDKVLNHIMGRRLSGTDKWLSPHRYRIIEFLAHGISDPAAPPGGQNEIVLEMSGGDMLRPTDLLQGRLQTDVVLLTACKSGSAGAYSREQFSGLTRTILQAGARSVVATRANLKIDSAEKTTKRIFNGLIDPDKSCGMSGDPMSVAAALFDARNYLAQMSPHNWHQWSVLEVIGDGRVRPGIGLPASQLCPLH